MQPSPATHCATCTVALPPQSGSTCARCILESGLSAGAQADSEELTARASQVVTLVTPELPVHNPRRIAGYKVLGVLGRGGMGEVFAAEHERLQRRVAIKAMPEETASDANAKERFLREARTASSLNHPNIVTVYDLVTHKDSDYIVMEQVDGSTLRGVMGSSATDLDTTVDYLRQLVAGLDAAHSAGIVHRDIKPANVMVSTDGFIKIMDFGLAKTTVEDTAAGNNARLTQLGAVLGTPHYMSPEQARGEWVAAPSDIFSWGILAYEMLTGALPFAGEDRVAVMNSICHTEPIPIKEILPELSEELAESVMQALHKAPRDRPSASAILERLKASQSSVSTAALTQSLEGVPITEGAQPATGSSARASVAEPTNAKRLRTIAIAAFIFIAVLSAAWLATRAFETDNRQGTETGVAEAPINGSATDYVRYGFQILDRYDREGAPDNAIAAFQRAIALQPESAPAYSGLAWAYFFKDDDRADPRAVDLALANAEEAVRQNEFLLRGQVALGAVRGKKGDFAGALEAFKEALEIAPRSAEAHREKAIVLRQSGDIEEAKRSIELSLSIDDTSWRAHEIAGALAYSRSEYDDAEAAFRRAARLIPDGASPYRNLAAVLQKKGDEQGAIEALQTALTYRPQAFVFSNLGTLLYFRGLYAKAAEAFERAVEMQPGFFTLWANLGDAQRRLDGRYADAQRSYRRAIQLVKEDLIENPGSATLRGRLALYLSLAGERESALQEIASVKAMQRISASTYYRLVIAQEALDMRLAALESLESALRAGYPLNDVKQEPELVQFRNSPEFHLLASQWEEAIEP